MRCGCWRYGALLLPIMLGLALLFALLLDRPRVGLRRFSRLAIFLPYAVPAVIASMLWGFLYLPAISPFNDDLAAVGLPEPDLLEPRLGVLRGGQHRGSGAASAST